MNDHSRVMDVVASFRNQPCPCGRVHETAIRDIRVGSGTVHRVGEILKENGFPRALLVVADKTTLRAADGILESLKGFDVTLHVWDSIRVAEMKHADEIAALIRGKETGVLSIGTGSVNDPCRLAAAREDKPLCIFGTAPSMDGFASYSSPIVKDGFKASYPAKSPEVVIGDTAILAKSPVRLKSAGFGDMVAKYVGLVDWKISHLLTGEYYCERVAALTRKAVDDLMAMAPRVREDDEEAAGSVFESLLLTGIGMSFTQNSRPASGSEHIVAHLIECVELRDGKLPNFHGEDIGVCTLEVMKVYEALAQKETVKAKKDDPNWEEIYSYYGSMRPEVEKVNTPDTITDAVDSRAIEENWTEIRRIIRGVPSRETCLKAMKEAGCKTTVDEIGKSPALFADCMKYSPYMRRRLTLLRMKDMIE